jgi:hypothetical protein
VAVFENTEIMYSVLGTLFTRLVKDPVAGPQFVEADFVIRFVIDGPDGEIWLTPFNNGEVICGPADIVPAIEMSLSGDTCHRFWLQEVSMPVALVKGLIRARGPVIKVLKMLPLLKLAYAIYPSIAREKGIAIT